VAELVRRARAGLSGLGMADDNTPRRFVGPCAHRRHLRIDFSLLLVSLRIARNARREYRTERRVSLAPCADLAKHTAKARDHPQSIGHATMMLKSSRQWRHTTRCCWCFPLAVGRRAVREVVAQMIGRHRLNGSGCSGTASAAHITPATCGLTLPCSMGRQ
jgi:hypothetical protein